MAMEMYGIAVDPVVTSMMSQANYERISGNPDLKSSDTYIKNSGWQYLKRISCVAQVSVTPPTIVLMRSR